MSAPQNQEATTIAHPLTAINNGGDDRDSTTMIQASSEEQMPEKSPLPPQPQPQPLSEELSQQQQQPLPTGDDSDSTTTEQPENLNPIPHQSPPPRPPHPSQLIPIPPILRQRRAARSYFCFQCNFSVDVYTPEPLCSECGSDFLMLNAVPASTLIDPAIAATLQQELLGNIPAGFVTIRDYSFDERLDQIADELNQNEDPNMNYGTPPASQSSIDSLQLIKVSDEVLKKCDNYKCVICQYEYQVGEEVKEFSCKHVYHPGCLDSWLDLHNSCPICRLELPTDDLEYEENKKKRNLVPVNREDMVEGDNRGILDSDTDMVDPMWEGENGSSGSENPEPSLGDPVNLSETVMLEEVDRIVESGNTVLEKDDLIVDSGNMMLEKDDPSVESGNTMLEKDDRIVDSGNMTLERDDRNVDSGNTVLEKDHLTVDSGNMMLEKDDLIVDSGNMMLEKDDLSVDSGNMMLEKDDHIVDSGNMMLERDDRNVDSGNMNHQGSSLSDSMNFSNAADDMDWSDVSGKKKETSFVIL